MAIENIVAKGVGFSPGSTKWLPTHGFGLVAVAFDETVPVNATFVFPHRPTRFVFPARPRVFVFPRRPAGYKE